MGVLYLISRWLVPATSTPLWDLLKWLILGVAAWAATTFLLPPIDALIKRVLADRSPTCRVLILGVSGVGKTSLIERWLTGQSAKTNSTKDFRVWDHTVRVELESGRTIPLTFADYRGQATSQIFTEARSFTQPNDKKSINAVLFVVDLFREVRDENANTLSDDATVEWMLNAQIDFDDRIARNNQYFAEDMLELFFTEFCNPPTPDQRSNRHIVSVQLLINKVDILKKLAAHRLPSLKPNFEPVAIAAYQTLAEQILNRCRANGIDPSRFSVTLVSARAGEPGDDIPVQIARAYSSLIGGDQ